MNIMIAENLRKLRLNKNITQDALAKYLGITPQSISKWGEIEIPSPRKSWLVERFIEKLGETYGFCENVRYKKLLCEVKKL